MSFTGLSTGLRKLGSGLGSGGGGTPSPFSSVTTATTFFTDDGSALRFYSTSGRTLFQGTIGDPGNLTLKDGSGATVATSTDLLDFHESTNSGCEIQFSSVVMTAGETYTVSLLAGALTENIPGSGITGIPAANNYPVTNTLIEGPASVDLANHHVHWAKVLGLITVGVGDDLTTIPDITGNGNHFTYHSGTKAKLQQDSDGRYYAHFTADGVYRMPLLADSATWSWCGAYKGVASGNGGGRLIAAELAVDNGLMGTWYNSGTSIQNRGQCLFVGDVCLLWSGSEASPDSYYYDVMVQNGSGARYYNSNTDVTVATTNTRTLSQNSQRWYLGGGYSPDGGTTFSEFFRGRFYGDLWTTTALSAGQRAQYQTYINSPTQPA